MKSLNQLIRTDKLLTPNDISSNIREDNKITTNKIVKDYALSYLPNHTITPEQANVVISRLLGRSIPGIHMVEYLESSGTQYIDTGIIPSFTKDVEIEVITACINDARNVIVGNYGGPESASVFNFEFDNRSGSRQPRIYLIANVGSSATDKYLSTVALNDVLTFKFDFVASTKNYSFAVTGDSGYNQSTSGTITISSYKPDLSTLLIFKDHRSDVSALSNSCRIYSIRIKIDGELVRDLIPIRDNTEGCMYDKITGNILRNEGTGDFTYGEDIIPIEYLESTGTQYIDIGLTCTDFNTANMLFTTTKSVSTNSCIVGAYYDSSSAPKFQIYIDNNNNVGYLSGVNTISGITSGQSIVIGTKYDVEFTIVEQTSNLVPVFLFARNNDSNNKLLFNGLRFYSFRFQKNLITIRDLIPVKVGNIGYMYDRISNKLYGNKGTGNFVLGQDIIPIEYLESTGTQYIDTEYNPTLDSQVKAIIQYTNSTGSMQNGLNITDSQRYIFSLQDNVNYTFYMNTNVVESISNHQLHKKGFGIDLLNNKIYCGYSSKEVSTGINSSIPFYLFARNYNGTPQLYCKEKLYSFSASNNIKSIDMIPVKVGSNGCLYDRVNARLYKNKGTGNFTLSENKYSSINILFDNINYNPKVTKSFYFNGSGNLTSINNLTGNFIDPKSKSFSIWAKSFILPPFGEFFKFSSLAIGYGVNDMTTPSNQLQILYERVAWNATWTNSNADKNWHHYCLTISSTGLPILYYDGVKVKEGTAKNFNTSDTAYFIGGAVAATGHNRYYKGYLTRFCIFSKILSDVEVLTDYQLGMRCPNDISLSTYVNMDLVDGVVKDYIGDYDLSVTGTATQSDDIPII